MRVGTNPLKGRQCHATTPVVLTAITHLPFIEGYHAQRLEVVKLCLQSMRMHAPDRDVAVFDNGSCRELTDWLRESYHPTYLTLSPNIGKMAARSALLRMFHPETIVAISDDDILFYPGWLDASMSVLETYPNVGVVSGYPIRTHFRWGCQKTIEWGKKHANARMGRFIPEIWERQFAESIGRPWLTHLMTSANDYDWIGEYKGVEAYLTGHHCQFVCYCGRLQPFTNWTHESLPDEKPFDIAIDHAGLLRLTTAMRYTRHIGNVVDEGIRKDAKEMGIEVG